MSTKDELITAKSALKDAKKDLVKFRKSNKLKAGETPEDQKLAKTMNKMVKEVEAKTKEVAELKDKLKAEKPKRGFKTKYDYPTVVDEDSGEEREMTAAEKKKFRAKARAEKKKAEQGETKPKKEKTSSKKKKKKEKPEEEDD